MDTKSLEQARQIYKTVQLMRTRFIRRHHSQASDNASLAHALTAAQAETLFVIRHEDGTTIKHIAEMLDVSAPSASAMVDRLVEMGAVTREQNPDDRREVLVRVSDAGALVVDKIEKVILENIVELIDKMGPAYAAKWAEVSERIREVLAEEWADAERHDDEKGNGV